MIAAIENAITARLQAASDADILGYKYRTLETYPAEWDAYLKDKGPIPAPAGWVTFAGWRRVPDSADQRPRVRLSFGLVVMSENARNETAQRHGGPIAAEPGSYQLAEDAVQLLAGRTLGLDMGGLVVGSLNIVGRLPAIRERPVSMLALELTTDVLVADGSFGEEPLDDFETFHANWDIPPHGGIDAAPATPGIQIPDDAHADATDTVTLEILP
jgi:phage gp37-like protein